jgi:ubiquinone/menaquinone biosynthesis C-methylase UbiE
VNDNIQHTYWNTPPRRRHPADRIIATFVRPKLDFAFRYIPTGGSVLDVGCGNGYFTYYLEQLGPTVGLDYSAAMLGQNPASNRVQGSALTLPFSDASFDVVLCSNLLHHLAHPVQAVVEMRRVSKRHVVLSEPNRNNPLMLALGLLKAEERESLRFTPAYLRFLAREAELAVIDCQCLGLVTPNRMPRAVADLLARFNRPTPWAAYSVLVAGFW